VRLSRAGKLGTPDGFRPPPWSWALDRGELRRLRSIPGVRSVQRLPTRRGRGVGSGVVLPLARRLPGVRMLLPSVWCVRL
jgi:hypothetical protein